MDRHYFENGSPKHFCIRQVSRQIYFSFNSSLVYTVAIFWAYLFQQTMLWIMGPDASVNVRSGGRNIKRNLTRGQQTYDTDKTTWPINQPILKLESYPQVSGLFVSIVCAM